MPHDSQMRRLIRFVVFIASLLPLAWLIWQSLTIGLGANPVEKIQRYTGDWTLNFIFITLAISPLQRITGIVRLKDIRRMVGLYTFFYASLHFINYIAIDQAFEWDAIIKDVAGHKRIIFGFISFIILSVLAVTSTNRMFQSLGARYWKALHQLIYITAIGAVVHFILLVKIDIRRPLIYAGGLVVLLGYRMALWAHKRVTAKR